MTLDYRELGSGDQVRYEHTSTDSSVTLRADRNSPVRISYAAFDSSGARRLVPGLTIHHTVGIGVERRHVEIDPIDASCPRSMLEESHEVHGTGEERVLIVTAGAESWGGQRSSIEPVSIRME